MSTNDNEEVYLTLTMWADSREDIIAMLREVIWEILRGTIASNGDGKMGRWQYEVADAAEQRNEAVQRYGDNPVSEISTSETDAARSAQIRDMLENGELEEVARMDDE